MLELINGKVYSGKEFNDITKGKRFVKLTVEGENHNGFQFKTGLNIDDKLFNPNGSCQPGGLYFCDFEFFGKYLNYNDKNCVNMRKVIIPDDAQVYIEEI